MQDKPAAQIAIDELHQMVTSPEDAAVLAEFQQELDAERAEHLQNIGNATLPKLVEVNGVVVTKDEAEDAKRSADPIGPYGRSGQR